MTLLSAFTKFDQLKYVVASMLRITSLPWLSGQVIVFPLELLNIVERQLSHHHLTNGDFAAALTASVPQQSFVLTMPRRMCPHLARICQILVALIAC